MPLNWQATRQVSVVLTISATSNENPPTVPPRKKCQTSSTGKAQQNIWCQAQNASGLNKNGMLLWVS